MAQVSAGILVFRRRTGQVEFLLAHPGGPYWANKDDGAWSIPKGLVEAGEANWPAARREFEEEIGQPIEGTGLALNPVRTSSGKIVHCWMLEADLDLTEVRSNVFSLEWPPRSGQMRAFPEIDRAGYFDAQTALRKVHKGQRPIIEEAFARLASS